MLSPGNPPLYMGLSCTPRMPILASVFCPNGSCAAKESLRPHAGLETGRKIHHLCISAVDGLTGSKAPGCLAAKLFHDRFQKPYRVVERASRFCLPMCAVTQKTHNFSFPGRKVVTSQGYIEA